MKKVTSVFFALFSLVFLATFVAQAVGISPLAGVGTIAALAAIRSFAPVASGLAFADPLTTIFTRELQKMLFPENSFYKKAFNLGSGASIDARYFEIPQELELPTAIINPTEFPLQHEELTDGAETVEMALIATKPTRLGDREEAEISFDKRKSILSRHNSVIEDKVAAVALNAWTPTTAGHIIDTDGASEATGLPGATGNRKAITKANFIKANEVLDRMEVKGTRYALVGATHYAQLLNITDFIDYNKTGNAGALLKGEVGEILGIKIMKRSTGVVYATGGAAKAVGAATASSDNEALLVWVENAVGIVEGANKVYINEGQAQYLGTIMNAAVRFGTKPMRTDKKGIVAIRQTVGA